MKEKFDPEKTFLVTITLNTRQVALAIAAIASATSKLREGDALSDYDEDGTDEQLAKQYDEIQLVFINRLTELAEEEE